MAHVHMILQGKGGVGKSMIASFIIQYLESMKMPYQAIDTDPINKTLAGYQEFNVKSYNIMHDDTVDTRMFDLVLENIFTSADDEHILIDNGASTFIALQGYLKENNAIQLLQQEGHEVFLHTVVTGGQAMFDTVKCLGSLCEYFPNVPIVIWLNLYFGNISMNGEGFESFKIYKDFANQFASIISLPDKTKITFGKDVEDLLAKRISFEAAINSSLPLMTRQRLATYRRELFEAIKRSGIFNAIKAEEGQE